MSFVAKLPLEIVHEIFVLCIDLSKFQAWNPDFRNRRASDYPIILTSICHMWSAAALSCPQLWSTLPIVIQRDAEAACNTEGEPTSAEHLPPLPVIARWIDLSRSTPIAISLRPGINEDDLDDARFSERYGFLVHSLFDVILLPHHSRWAKVSLRIPSPFPTTHGILSALSQPSAYAKLTEFSFHGLDSDEDESAVLALVHILSHSPQLSSVALHEIGAPRHSAALQNAIPWKGLSSVFLNKDIGKRYSAQGILQLLRNGGVPNLDYLGISMHQTGDIIGSLHIQHEKLSELDLQRSCPAQFLLFVAHLTLPNLRSLTMPADCMEEGTNGHDQHCGTQAMPQFGTVVPAFIKRSRCRLKKLHYHEDFVFPSAERQVLPILQAVHDSVEHLQFIVGPREVVAVLCLLCADRGSEVVDIGYDLDTAGKQNVALFPQLKHLTITAWVSADAPPGKYSQLVLGVIESLWNPSKCSFPYAQTQYIDVGMRIQSLGGNANNSELKSRSWSLMGMEDLSSRLRGLVEGPHSGIILGQVNHSKRIRITVGGSRGHFESGIFKPYFDTWLSHGIWVPR